MLRRTVLRLPVVVALGVGSLSAAGAAPAHAEPSALHVPGDVHLAVFGSPGATGVGHTIRHGNGSWDRFGNLRTSHSQRQLASAIVNGEEHLLFEDYSGLPYRPYLHHMIRHADGSWTEGTGPGGPGAGASTADLAVAAVAGELHRVRRSTEDNVLRHAVRRADGTWSTMTDVPVPATPDSGVTIAGVGGELRLLIDNVPGGTALSSFVRHADGTWEQAPDVPFTPPAVGVTATSVNIAQVGTELHALVRGSDGGLYHSLQRSTGRWETFHSIAPEAGTPEGTVSNVSITASRGTLHVAVSTSAKLLHTIRLADGRWHPFGDVTRESGLAGSSTGLTIAGE